LVQRRLEQCGVGEYVIGWRDDIERLVRKKNCDSRSGSTISDGRMSGLSA
jgi:hypothetical protein